MNKKSKSDTGDEIEVVEVAVEDILGLVDCSEMYGHTSHLILDTFASWLDYYVTDEDIENYSRQYLTEESKVQGYDEEHYTHAKKILTEWRDRYCEGPEDGTEEAETPEISIEKTPTKH